MEINIKENGRITQDKENDVWIFIMEINMKGIGKMIKHKEKELFIIITEKDMTDVRMENMFWELKNIIRWFYFAHI